MSERLEPLGTPTHLVYVTVGSFEEAKTIATTVVRERLAACANIFPQMVSVYEWQGTLQQDEECVVILKTPEKRVSWLTDRLVQLHSYDCPCVVSMPLASGHEAFISWVQDQTRPVS